MLFRLAILIQVLVLSTGAAPKAKPAASPVASKPATAPASRPVSRSLVMRGVVFEDLDADGLRDDNEPTLRDMSVSDGLGFVRTQADGRFEFKLREQSRGSVFVCTPAGWRASKQFFVIADFGRYADKVQPADIGLVRDPARNTDRFVFVQLSDTHVTEAESAVQTMAEDLEVVNNLSDKPTFVVTTGDLTNVGKQVAQLAGYVRATRDSRCPFYNVVGNHDYGGELRDTENYEKYLGPPYYSFDVGPYHFIARDIIARDRKSGFFERQTEWIERDLRLNAVGKRVVVFQHYIPTIRELDWWAERNGAAVFSGHWHGRREREYKGILDVNSSTLRFGGIDRSPRGFRMIHVDGQQMRCEWRLGAQKQRIEIVHPPVNGLTFGRAVPIRILAYDTAVRVTGVRYRVFDAGDAASNQTEPIAQGDLWAEGSWTWAGRWQVSSDVWSGMKRIEVEAAAADGTVWKQTGVFKLDVNGVAIVKPGQAWPFFHNDAGHRGYVSDGPRPPLVPAWSTHIGGTIHISSPVIADGRVYAASSFESSLDDCAITALDLVTGGKLWRAPVDSSIKHSLAVWDGNIMAVSQAATLYCLNKDGFPRWTASLDRGHDDRWETSFPVTDGKVVYAGRCTGFGAYDLASGEPLWKQPGGKDWWPNIYSGPSLGTGVVYQGGPFARALDPATGDIRWSNNQMAVSTVAVVPAAVEQSQDGDRLYVFQNKKTLLCLDGRSGQQLWEAAFESADGQGREVIPLGDETGTPAIGEDVVCVGGTEVSVRGQSPDAAMHGFDKATGKLRWRFPVGQELSPTVPYKRDGATITSSPVIVGDVVYFGASDGWFHALDVSDGHLLWKYWFGLPIASTPAVSGNALIITTWDGTVHTMVAAD